MDITFKLHHFWVRDGAKKIARRVCNILFGEELDKSWPVYRDGQWHMNTGNDWWLAIDLKGASATLTYRYGDGGNAAFMKGLAEVLNWVFTRSN